MTRMVTKTGRSVWPKGSTVILTATGVALAATVAARLWVTLSDEAMIGIVGAVSAFGFFLVQNALESARFRRELFLQFNEKYDKLNQDLLTMLAELESQGDSALQSHKGTLEDYFNLCGEEYYYFRRGYVDTEVWRNWLRGMHWWYERHRAIRDYWNAKLDEDSYYGLTRELIETGRCRGKPDSDGTSDKIRSEVHGRDQDQGDLRRNGRGHHPTGAA